MALPKKYEDFTWDFAKDNTKYYTHCMHVYPAMMIPQVAGGIIDKYALNAKILFDPYCGTGTSLVEANVRGINSIGTDINPLARLISKVKTSPLDIFKLDEELERYEQYVYELQFNVINTEFINELPKDINLTFWFQSEVIEKLAIIKHFINSINDPLINSFFKICFSETVRECSLTRNSEFKLYRMNQERINKFKPDVYSTMTYKLIRNKNGLKEFLRIKPLTSFSSIHDFDTIDNAFLSIVKPHSIDIVVTSPPYGDSHTTVAYGQFSRLSLEWLDIPNSKKLDSKMMGNKKEVLSFKYHKLRKLLDEIRSKDEKRALEVEHFYSDYYQSITNVAKTIKPLGFACYVVGNRRVKGLQLPTDEITKHFFEKNGFKYVETIIRNIPNKRMPKRNSPNNIVGETSQTMHHEFIVIMQNKS